jgi:hypothetical protein
MLQAPRSTTSCGQTSRAPPVGPMADRGRSMAPYSSSTATSSSVAARQYLVPLFDQYHVALVQSGNSHN